MTENSQRKARLLLGFLLAASPFAALAFGWAIEQAIRLGGGE